jgi:hypothetical protein
MIEIYTSKGGMSLGDATRVIDTLLPYRRFFLDHMMVMELGVMPFARDRSGARGRGGGMGRGREGGREGGA